MTNSGDAAEQVVRMSLEGVEIAAKLVGAGAKNIAVFLYAALANHDKKKDKPQNRKTRGRERLKSMIASGKELKIFGIREGDLKGFAADAKRYGIVYCVLRNRKKDPDGLCDIMVKSEDAARIDRILTRFHYVDRAALQHEPVPIPTNPEPKNRPREGEPKPTGPPRGKTAKSRPSKPFSEPYSKAGRGTTDQRPSVREQLRNITAEQKQDADRRTRKQRGTKPRSKPGNQKKKWKGRANR